jgi:hypothetical protein
MKSRLVVALIVVAIVPGVLGAATPRCGRHTAKAARQLFARMLVCERLVPPARTAACASKARSRLFARMSKLARRCGDTCMAEASLAVARATVAALQAAVGGECVATPVPPPPASPMRLLVAPADAAPRDCGGPGYAGPSSPPFSGEVIDAGDAAIASLEEGCVYLGGGTILQSTSFLRRVEGAFVLEVEEAEGSDVATLLPTDAPGRLGCTQGLAASGHCAGNILGGYPCVVTADCSTGLTCVPDAQCLTTPPLDLLAGTIPVCLVNVVREDISGTADLTTGAVSATQPLQTRIYLTTCPRCVAGLCEERSANFAEACTSPDGTGASVDCLPDYGTYLGAVDFDSMVTTDEARLAAADGVFCAGQTVPGAFGLADAREIVENGARTGDLHDGDSHPGRGAIAGCVLASGNPLIDDQAGLPFPLAVSYGVEVQLLP